MLHIPKFDSNWTEQMEAYLVSIQGQFDGAHEWCEWLVEKTQAICRSWGCTDKWNRPKSMLASLITAVGDMLEEPNKNHGQRDEYLADMENEVNNWAGFSNTVNHYAQKEN